jgi:hypothetical protein
MAFSPSLAYAQNARFSLSSLPPAGTLLETSEAHDPATIRGLTIYPDEPFRFDFLIDTADDQLSGQALQEESEQLIKYFLSALTVPNTQQWVNLSPNEQNRVIPAPFRQTTLGLNLLAQDYLLKQLTASLMYPEREPGKAFWERVYAKTHAQFKTRDIPLNALHKVWVVPDKAVVYNNGQRVFIVDSQLKVMMEEDYDALRAQDNSGSQVPSKDLSGPPNDTRIDTQIMKEIILPEIEKEINHGTLFAPLRQIYQSVILAAWYKKNLRESLLARIIADQNKTGNTMEGVDNIVQDIYSRYMSALKKGVFDYIKEDYDPARQEVVPRRYFSGGVTMLDVIPEEWEGPIASLPESSREVLLDRQREITAVNVQIVIDIASDEKMRLHSLQAITQQPIHANTEETAIRIKDQVKAMIARARQQGIDINTLAPLEPVHAGIIFNQGGFYITLEDGSPRFYSVNMENAGMEQIEEQITRAVKDISAQHKVKIVSAGIVSPDTDGVLQLGSHMWNDLDVNGFAVTPDMIAHYEQMDDEARALSAATLSASQYKSDGPFEIYQVRVDEKTNLVQVDPLLSLADYREMASEEEWEEFQYWTNKIKDRLSLFFVNSTEQGGGVALMRHSDLRILQQSGVDAQWFVMRQVPQGEERSFFDITKESFHNTFQGRSSKRLDVTDENILEFGWEQQLPAFEEALKNAKDSLVVVVDDYQPSGMVEDMDRLAEKYNKKIEFIYRSHIHFEADMSEGMDARHNWDYLWEKIRDHVKLAVIHPTEPIEESVPPNVPQEVGTVVMNPSTDIFDGLNKRLPADILLDSLLRFNQFLPIQNDHVLTFLENNSETLEEWFGSRNIEINGDFLTPLDLTRPYVIQVARFDPSKNIAGALHAFALFREQLQADGVSKENLPQLVLTGHGAIDDPDGMKYLIDTMDRVHHLYPELARDVKIARLPHHDQVLNALLRYSFAALQLSFAEGFEIKVSETLQKAVPAIVYNVGGLGRQVVDGETGYLIDPPHEALTKMPRGLDNPLLSAEEELAEQMPALIEVADHLYDLFTQEDLYTRMQAAAYRKVMRDKFGLVHAIRWSALAAVADAMPKKDLAPDQVFREPVDIFLDHAKVRFDGPSAVRSEIEDVTFGANEDHAMAVQKPASQDDLGGIDMNPDYIDLIEKKGGQTKIISRPLAPNALVSVTGVKPIILNIQPINISTYLNH